MQATVAAQSLERARASLRVAVPEPGSNLKQDEEWILVEVDDEWKKLRLHDYADFYSIPGLYERVVYDTLQCQSPAVVAQLLKSELA